MPPPTSRILQACRRLYKSKTSPPPAAPSNFTVSPPEDEACQETAYEPALDVQFDSMGEQWQATRADSLQCKIWKNLKTEGPSRMDHEHKPGVTARIIGDGNSFFRTLSYFLTGAQREHQHLRALLSVCENNEEFNAIANQKDYVITSKVSQLGEYATEVEIFAAATFLGTRSGHSLLMVIPTDGSVIGQCLDYPHHSHSQRRPCT